MISYCGLLIHASDLSVVGQFEKKKIGNAILSRSNEEAKNLANSLTRPEILRPAASE